MDIVTLVFAGIIASTILATIIGVIIAEIVSPGYDATDAVMRVGELIKTMTAGLLGILAGKGDVYQKQLERNQKKENGTET